MSDDKPRNRQRVRPEGSYAQRVYFATTEYKENKEHQKKVIKELLIYVHSTTYVPAQPHIHDVENPYDAAGECEHGFLHVDKNITCGCFG